MKQLKQPTSCVYSQISMNAELMDIRTYSYGIIFGTVEDLCRQYGIKYKQLERCVEFSAPRSRLQIFIEKLHFSRQSYSYNPY